MKIVSCIGCAAHYLGDLSMPFHNLAYDDCNRANHGANDGIVETTPGREAGIMKTRTIRLLLSITLVLALAMPAPARATAEVDPPSRVARLAYLEGEVSFNPAGTDDWVAPVINRPITTGDRFWCDANARAELHLGSAAIRLGHRTGFSLLNLTDQMLQIRLPEGGISLRVRRLAANEIIEINTPNLAFSIRHPGRYRIDVNEAGDATIIGIREGEGEVFANGASYSVHAGQQGYFRGMGSLHANFTTIPPQDAFDLWADGRDNRQDSYPARHYVSEDVIGYEDLNDEYGDWRSVPHHGHVWFPRVSVVGWAPYRHGHWAWVSPWGWTWIDDAPWGFAPFHYGRWVHVHGKWGWIPCRPRTVGVAYVRPVYAPALVAWVGGHRGGVGVTIGAVSWFPLGPRDVYMPSYPASRTYVQNVNITNTTVNKTVINNYYNNPATGTVRSSNQNVAGAVTSVSPQSFTSAQPVAGNMTRITAKQIAATPATTSAPPIAPPKKAVLGAGVATAPQPPAASINRQVVVKSAPPQPAPDFATHQAAIEENKGRPISIPQSRQLQSPLSQTVVAPPVKVIPKTQPDTPPATRKFEDRPPTARPAAPVNEPKSAPSTTSRQQSLPQDSQPQQYGGPSKAPLSEDRPAAVPPAFPLEESKPAPRDSQRPSSAPRESQPSQYEAPAKSRTVDDRPAAPPPAMRITPQFEPKQPPSPPQPQPQPSRQERTPAPPPSKQGKQTEQEKGLQPKNPFQ